MLHWCGPCVTHMWFTGALWHLSVLGARGVQGLNLTIALTLGNSLTLQEVEQVLLEAFSGEPGHFTYCAMVSMLCVTGIYSLVKLGQLISHLEDSHRMSFFCLGLTVCAVFGTGVRELAEASEMVGMISLGSGLIACIAGRPVIGMLGLLAPAVLTVGGSVLTGKWSAGLPVHVEVGELVAKASLWIVLGNAIVKRAIGKLFTYSTTPFLLALTVLTMIEESLGRNILHGPPGHFHFGKIVGKTLSHIVLTFSVLKRAIGKLFTWRTTSLLELFGVLVIFSMLVTSPHSNNFFRIFECIQGTEFGANILLYLGLGFAVFKCTIGELVTHNVTLILLLGLPIVQAVCPHCSNHCTDCTFDTDGKCPALGEVVMNAAIIGGLTAGVGKALQVKLSILPRFIRAIGGAAMHFIQLLAAQKGPHGTPFVHDIDTSGHSILSAIGAGVYSINEALLRISELQDGIDDSTEPGERQLKKLDRLVKMLEAAVRAGSVVGGNAAARSGVFTFLFAKVTEFVHGKEMQVKVKLEGPTRTKDTEEECKPCEFSAKVTRVTTELEFAEILNLFVMFCAALGLADAPLLCQFLEFVVFDTIRQRLEPWQVAQELLIIMLRRIEDSGGALTFRNAFNESHLNAYVDEARRNAAHFYPKLSSIFRSPGGNPGATKTGGKLEWNKKFTTSSMRCCPAFNNKTEHHTNMLFPDGTCKYNHVCSAWVSDKGKNGKCLQNHPKASCTNPKRCDDPQQ